MTNPVQVLEQLSWQAEIWYQKKHAKDENYTTSIIADAELLPNANYTQTQKDLVKSFSSKDRQFGFRVITKKRIRLKNPCYVASEVKEHDIMGCL